MIQTANGEAFTIDPEINRRKEKSSQAPAETAKPQTNSLQQGSGRDVNSDARRLRDEENRLDKMIEDSFPASDPPSGTITGIG